METLYRKLYGLRSTVLEYWIIYLVSVVMNYLGEREVISGEQTFWQKMLDLGNAPVFILLVLSVLHPIGSIGVLHQKAGAYSGLYGTDEGALG